MTKFIEAINQSTNALTGFVSQLNNLSNNTAISNLSKQADELKSKTGSMGSIVGQIENIRKVYSKSGENGIAKDLKQLEQNLIETIYQMQHKT